MSRASVQGLFGDVVEWGEFMDQGINPENVRPSGQAGPAVNISSDNTRDRIKSMELGDWEWYER